MVKKIKEKYSGLDDTKAGALADKVLGHADVTAYKANKQGFDTNKEKLEKNMRAHQLALVNNPLANLIAEAESAENKVEDMPSDLTRAPASPEGADICANIDKEIDQVAADTCVDKTDGKTKCISDERAKLELNSTNGMNSKLRVTARANSILTSLDKGRGIASAQDWSNIGENANDSCEATAANGRNFMGIDLGEFDMATGAMQLGNTGAVQ